MTTRRTSRCARRKVCSCNVLLVLCLLVASLLVDARRPNVHQHRRRRAVVFHHHDPSPPSSAPTTALSLSTRGRALSFRGGARTSLAPPSKTSHSSTTSTTTGASIPSHVFNLIKSIVGAGVLGLPAGIAAYDLGQAQAVVPALGLIVMIGSMAAYGFSVIGRLCAATDTKSYREVWKATVSPHTSWMPTMACLLVTTCSVLSYSMILSQTIPALIQFILPHSHLSNVQGLLGITLVVLLPLCLLKSLAALAPFSLLGIFGMLYTCLAMVVRYRQGVYADPNSDLLLSLPQYLRPSFPTTTTNSWCSTNAFVLISMLATAYMAHYNAPKFYHELQNPTVSRFQTVVLFSFVGSMVLLGVVACVGYLTFGQAAQGLILHNYSPTHDSLMTMSRFAVTLSLLCSYPLAFGGVRDGVRELLGISYDDKAPWWWHTGSTIVLLAMITVVALIVTDLRLVFALGGATWGNCLIYIFPAVMMVQYHRKQQQNNLANNNDLVVNAKKEWPLAVANGVLGLIMGVIGTVRAIQSI